MFTRIALLIVAVISIGWISYMSYDMISGENEYNPTFLFSDLDEQIFIINQSSDLLNIIDQFQTTKENRELINLIDTSLDFQMTMSLKRNHALFTTPKIITQSYLKLLFNEDPSLKIDGFNSFKIKGYSGKFHRNSFYIYSELFDKSEKEYKSFQIDKNATASLINLEPNTYDVTDIYLKSGNTIEFKRKIDGDKFGGKVSDEQLFGSILSSQIENYEFFETDFIRTTDAIFASGPMNSWVKTGLVKVTIDGKSAVITDYREGQNPINVMCEELGIEPRNYENEIFKSTSLITNLDDSGPVYFYLMDDYVVISNDKSTCEKIVADYKLGNTLTHNVSKRDRIYANLPRKVNYRKVSGIQKEATSIYKNVLLTTKITTGGKTITDKESNSNINAINVNETILDFYQPEENQLFVISKNSKILFFLDGKKSWEKSLSITKQLGSPQMIDVFGNNKNQLLIASEKRIDLIDINGNNVPGFPIDLKGNSCLEKPVFYKWKNQSYILIAIEGGQLLQFNSEGKKTATIKTKISKFELQPIVWASSNKPFVGVYGDSKFEMIQLESKQSLRIFDAPNCTHYLNKPNELFLIGYQNGKLVQYNQRGEETNLTNDYQGEIINVDGNTKLQTIIVKQEKSVILLNSKGEKWATIPIDFDDIGDVKLYDLENGQIALTIINNLENNVYLWKYNGSSWIKKPFEGSLKASLSSYKTNNYTLTTVVDKILVQYEDK